MTDSSHLYTALVITAALVVLVAVAAGLARRREASGVMGLSAARW